MATTTHSRVGLMRPVWSGREIRGDRPIDWTFTPDQKARIRLRLATPADRANGRRCD